MPKKQPKPWSEAVMLKTHIRIQIGETWCEYLGDGYLYWGGLPDMEEGEDAYDKLADFLSPDENWPETEDEVIEVMKRPISIFRDMFEDYDEMAAIYKKEGTPSY